MTYVHMTERELLRVADGWDFSRKMPVKNDKPFPTKDEALKAGLLVMMAYQKGKSDKATEIRAVLEM